MSGTQTNGPVVAPIPPVARSIDDTAATYGWTRSFIYERLQSGELQARKAGRRTLVVVATCDRLFESLPAAKFRAPRKAA